MPLTSYAVLFVKEQVKRAFIVPGWKATSKSSWFEWLAARLTSDGVPAVILNMPHPWIPIMDKWQKAIQLSVGKADEGVYLIGHSAGAAAILRYLESLPAGSRIGGCVLVAGFPQALFHKKLPHFLTRRSQVGKLSGKCGWLLAIHSDDDWRVPLSNGHWLADKLGAKLIVLKSAGHITAKSGYRELPEEVYDAIRNLIETDPSHTSP